MEQVLPGLSCEPVLPPVGLTACWGRLLCPVTWVQASPSRPLVLLPLGRVA